MHILIIEDNKTIADNEKRFLETEGFIVDVEYNGRIWLEKALANTYDMIILDIMLPEVDWITICKTVRAKKQTPIIMTTAKGELEDKGEWFETWADDYLVKPFALEELVMRIHAIVKRSDIPNIYRFGDVQLLPNEQSISKNGVAIKLTHKEFLLVEYLAQRKWQAISRTDLIDYIWWWDSWENDGTLDVYIANVRKKLWKDTIETIKWFGYKIV
jgi:two-component system, OmpR family, response regulator ArlR